MELRLLMCKSRGAERMADLLAPRPTRMCNGKGSSAVGVRSLLDQRMARERLLHDMDWMEPCKKN